MIEEELHAAEDVPAVRSKEVGDGFTIAAVQRARPAECSGRDMEADALDAWYMRAPLDLQCPITGDLYCDPVLTENGQVYERAAIVRHLESHDTDPLTNTVLKSKCARWAGVGKGEYGGPKGAHARAAEAFCVFRRVGPVGSRRRHFRN
ncbi:hypothetical protein H632_c2421p0 [Helicosporidium sp. ATCC 50920]|nr:hypothetical protein H632_c2421p0 [Helicosporidium sp. ATCC 50920]|eukprot:KDD73213.1 hypothetical protein H632_c2421p0 [Helicosporidium sp. ATCC 50920]